MARTARHARPHPIQQSDATRAPAPLASRRSRVHEPAGADPDHHLWRNGRLWWVAFTVIHEGWRQERVRVSLQTDDVEVARRRRDDLFRLVDAAEECEISLRFARRGRNRPRAGLQETRHSAPAAACRV